MKKIFLLLAFACILFSCSKKKENVVEEIVQQPVKEVYQPVHQKMVIDFQKTIMYNYFEAPKASAAKSVTVNFDQTALYVKPIEVVYLYENGDTFTYVLEKFGVWQNENGKYRIITDEKNTVWVQGQTKSGKFKEFVFYGNPEFNGKISPNSYRNLPKGEIKYRN